MSSRLVYSSGLVDEKEEDVKRRWKSLGESLEGCSLNVHTPIEADCIPSKACSQAAIQSEILR
jgi:hypothetical protein